MKEKRQTSAQRVANPVWLRGQIQKLIKDCADNIREDLKLAVTSRDDAKDKYLARVESDQHWKRLLERILRGKTFAEELREGIQ